MATLDIQIDSRKALAKLDQIPDFISKEIRTRFRTLGQTLRNELRVQMPRASGRASRAIFSRFARKQDRNDITLLVGGNIGKAPYLGILERGGTIKPKRSQFLAVPIGPAVERHGAAKFSAKDLKANPQAFGYVRTFVRDDVVLGERASGDIVPLFALEKQIIRPRASAPAPIRKFRDKNEARVKREIEEAITAGIQAAGKGTGGEGE